MKSTAHILQAGMHRTHNHAVFQPSETQLQRHKQVGIVLRHVLISSLAGYPHQGLLTLIESALLGLFFRPARQNERCVARLHERMITQLGGKIAPALRVEPEKSPLCVARRSFGVTKHLSLRLDWRFFSLNRVDSISVNRP